MRVGRVMLGALGAMALTVGLGLPAAADSGHGHGHVIKVRALDTCDPLTFNLALGPGACAPVKIERHPLTFAGLVASVDPVNHTATAEWRFKPDMIEAEPGDAIRVTNLGGEAHSFTEVPAFGGGCVPPVNELLGFGPTDTAVENCGAAFAGVLGPGQTGPDMVVGGPGLHRYLCIIHPWMHATVNVENDD